MKLKGINSLLRIESDDLKEQISKLQKKEQQVSVVRIRMLPLNCSVEL